MKIVIAIVIFSIIILFHEFGHFLFARLNGIEVVEFSLGMGPSLFSKKIGGTIYSLKLLPLGGSCMMLGEDDEDERPGTFNSASVWGRISVIAAGPGFNFIMAFVFALIIIALIGYTPASVTQVQKDSPAEAAGLQSGDKITEFNGYSIDIEKDLDTYIAVMGTPKDRIEMTVEREGEMVKIAYQPETYEKYLLGFNRASTDDGDPVEVGSLISGMPLEDAGIVAGDLIVAIDGNEVLDGAAYNAYIKEHPLSAEPIEVVYSHHGESHTVTITPAVYTQSTLGFAGNYVREKGNVLQVLKYSVLEIKYWVRTTILSLKELILGRFGLRDLSGPVGVVNVIGDTYEQSKSEGTLWVWVNMLNMAVLLSANLGVMNLLPIPALDGGRLVFLIIEAMLRRPLNRKIEGMVHFAGLMVLMLLMVVVMYNDLLKIF